MNRIKELRKLSQTENRIPAFFIGHGSPMNGIEYKLNNYESLGSEARCAIPTPEHYLPVLYALALKKDDEEVALFNDELAYGSLSMTSVKIGN